MLKINFSQFNRSIGCLALLSHSTARNSPAWNFSLQENSRSRIQVFEANPARSNFLDAVRNQAKPSVKTDMFIDILLWGLGACIRNFLANVCKDLRRVSAGTDLRYTKCRNSCKRTRSKNFSTRAKPAAKYLKNDFLNCLYKFLNFLMVFLARPYFNRA
jgi:hypothetical protein